jgi:hypothetical protein
MAHQRLGHPAEARKLLDRLCQLLQDARWKTDAEAWGFLHEAESIILPPNSSGESRNE